MADVVILFLAALGTAVATGFGVIPVVMLRERASGLTPVLLGFSAGVMTIASVFGLLVPASREGSAGEIAAGLIIGAAFLLVAERRFEPDTEFRGRSGPETRSAALVFLVLAVHSLPEGLAIGAAYASDSAGLSLFVILAIAIQNVPEGTAVAVPMQRAGFGFGRQFWTAVQTSLPQPLGALVAYAAVEQVETLLPVSFAFAAGAMLALCATELLPDAYRARRPAAATSGLIAGGGVMYALAVLLGV